MRAGQLVLLAGVEILLRTQHSDKQVVGPDCGVDQRRLQRPALGEPGRVVTAERATDERSTGVPRRKRLQELRRPRRPVRQRRRDELRTAPRRIELLPEELCLPGMRRAVEAVDVYQQGGLVT